MPLSAPSADDSTGASADDSTDAVRVRAGVYASVLRTAASADAVRVRAGVHASVLRTAASADAVPSAAASANGQASDRREDLPACPRA